MMMERVGAGCIFLTVLLIGANSKPAPSNGDASAFQPGLAMHCGKSTQYRDLDTGEWISDPSGADCMKDNEAVLAYCKKVYPSLQITNILEDTEKVHVPTWCVAGSSPPCHGHGHYIIPFKCVVGEYQTKALEVPPGCTFEHTHDYKVCKSEQDWKIEAGRICLAKGQDVRQPQMLSTCTKADEWQGVQFLCCDKPALHKPKPGKGKAKTPVIDVIDKTDINPICLQPSKVGFCRARLPAWYYDSDTKKCEPFNYGGCGGNDNNFKTQTECNNACSPGKSDPKKPAADDKSICKLPRVSGPCRAMFPMFYFDANVGECLRFVYGGCNGNENKFRTKSDCEGRCREPGKPAADDSICSLPKATGPCRAAFPNYFYDAASGKCLSFMYGGCNGNANRFQAKSACEARCGGNKGLAKPPYNLLPLGPGPVLLDEDFPAKLDEVSTTTTIPPTTTEDAYYSDKTTLDNEHDVFLKKLGSLKSEHKAKVTQILGKWDDDNARLKTSSDDVDHEQLESDLQQTISSLEDEYDDKMDKLNEFHKGRMNEMFGDARAKVLQKLLNQLSAETPKARHILGALEKYIEVERQDKTHTLQHYYMATHDEFDEDSVPDFIARLSEIDGRINSTLATLNEHPELLERIREEVDDLFASVPPSPDYGEDEDGLDDDEILDIIEEEMPVIGSTTDTPIKIDDGGIPDPDICRLPAVVGPCKASLISYYYNSESARCELFYYGGCAGNENNFGSKEACEAACSDNSFNQNYVLDEEKVDDDYYEDEEEDGDEFDIDANSIDAAMRDDDDDEDATEDETQLDEDVDDMFDIDGNPKDKFDVILNEPQPIYTGHRASSGIKIKSAEVSGSQLLWIGIGAGILVIIAIVAVIVYKRGPATRPPRVVVDKVDSDEKEMSPEEKQLLQLQQNGYENPTYKFFERQARA